MLIDLDSLHLITLPLRIRRDLKHSASRSFSSTPRPSVEKRKGQHYNARDQYLRQQAKQRREANLSRQKVLQGERAKAMGNPIRGVTTPFLESLDRAQSVQTQPPPGADSRKPQHHSSAEPRKIPVRRADSLESLEQAQSARAQPPSDADSQEILEKRDHFMRDRSSGPPSFIRTEKQTPSPVDSIGEEHLNHLLTKRDLERSLEFSQRLSEPIVKRQRTRVDPWVERLQIKEHQSRDMVAREVISRITSLKNASSREKTMTNVQRIIHEFGRHNTDAFLKPKAPANLSQPNRITQKALPRVGPDTGSSEVQIGILTAKIRVLADRYQGENRNDKVNKRNLLLLLHRRQKLLKYMEKKERGSGRWQNMIESLGLTEITWKGEISI